MITRKLLGHQPCMVSLKSNGQKVGATQNSGIQCRAHILVHVCSHGWATDLHNGAFADPECNQQLTVVLVHLLALRLGLPVAGWRQAGHSIIVQMHSLLTLLLQW